MGEIWAQDPFTPFRLGCAALLIPVWLALTSLADGETCPAAVDVETRVRAILHLPAEHELSESFLVERHEAGLYVELRGADTTLIGQRTLPLAAGATCEELSQASAVVLSAWLSDVHPDFAGALPKPEPEPAPEPEPEKQEPKPVPEAKATPKPAEVVAPLPSAEVPRRSHHRFELEVALGIDIAGSSVALALPVGVGYEPLASGLGVHGFFALSLSHQLELLPGQVVWRRWPIGVGPTYRFASGNVAWDVGAGGLVGWLHATGKNFDHLLVKDGPTAGGYLAAQVGSRLPRGRHWGVYGTVIAELFPGQVDFSVTGLEGQARLPLFSVGLGLGARFAP
jgi:hypothetical protein